MQAAQATLRQRGFVSDGQAFTADASRTGYAEAKQAFSRRADPAADASRTGYAEAKQALQGRQSRLDKMQAAQATLRQRSLSENWKALE